jgi:transposase-like protein
MKAQPTPAEVRRVLNEWGTVTAAARHFGVSRPTFYKWMHQYGILGRVERAKVA